MPRRGEQDTQFARFLRRERITPLFLADTAGVSRRYVYALCAGESDPTRRMMVRLARAISYRLQRPVEVAELFDLTIDINEDC
jgi:plasmid maintenance system antidote protein VapI